MFVFPERCGELQVAHGEHLIGLPEQFVLPEQFGAGNEGVTALPGKMLAGLGQAKERQKQSPDRQFDLAGCVVREAEYDQRHQTHHAKRYVVRLLKHCSPARTGERMSINFWNWPSPA